MKDFVKIKSDYSPDTYLTIAMSEDGDIALKIYGDDEMRIATSGSRFHGKDLVKILDAFQNLMRVIDEVS
jgi:hypothetical protein